MYLWIYGIKVFRGDRCERGGGGGTGSQNVKPSHFSNIVEKIYFSRIKIESIYIGMCNLLNKVLVKKNENFVCHVSLKQFSMRIKFNVIVILDNKFPWTGVHFTAKKV